MIKTITIDDSTHRVVPVELINQFPEINLNNYGEDDVRALNEWGISVLLVVQPEAPQPEPVDVEPFCYVYPEITYAFEMVDCGTAYRLRSSPMQFPLFTHPPADDELRLDKPAMVGSARFGKGVSWKTVIGAAQRHYENEVTPSKEAERIKNAAASLAVLRDQIGVESLDELRRDAERWRTMSALMFLGNVECTQDADGGYRVELDPAENMHGVSWEGNSPEEAIDAAMAKGEQG